MDDRVFIILWENITSNTLKVLVTKSSGPPLHFGNPVYTGMLVLHGQTPFITLNHLGMYVKEHPHTSFLQHQCVSSILSYLSYATLQVQAMQEYIKL